ncbi:MAG: endopeptidase La [Oscillospiraceae bacterium]|jgi:ATP-dependent Lon protease|nr:endopeptidase La [Oscillospiraceae bacterium]
MSSISYEPHREMPVVPLRGLVIFPDSRVHFEVGRKSSIAAIKTAMKLDREIFVVTQKDLISENPAREQLHQVGVVATVRQVHKGSDGDGARVYVEGQRRASIVEITQTKPYIAAKIEMLPDLPVAQEDQAEEHALVRKAKTLFDACAQYITLPPDIPLTVLSIKTAGRLGNYIADNLPLHFDEKQAILVQRDPLDRLRSLCATLAREANLQQVEAEINRQVQEQMDRNQRENFLREQKRAISAQLGEFDAADQQRDDYHEQIQTLPIPQKSKEKLLKDLARLERTQDNSPEFSMLQTYIETVLALPWCAKTKDKINLETARKQLDRGHYGMRDVKERILQLLAVRRLAPDIPGQILCLVGSPGVGKTSIANAVAGVMGRKFARISLGGIRDEAEIRGHRKTYIGAMPGRIITAIEQAGSSNPVLLLDEIDKLSKDYHGDPASALLEVMDGEQNSTFRDHYLEVPFDLSQVLFITTANDLSGIPAPLRDRMEIIELPSYTQEEKFHIAKKHLLPKQLERHGLKSAQLKISDAALRGIAEGYTREAGVRKLEQKICEICRKTAMRVVEDESFRLNLRPDDLETWLGARKNKGDIHNEEAAVGVVNGLAWTSIGGDVMPIEALVMPGTGKLSLTGSLGDVMKESARAALSYLRFHADALDLPRNFHKESDIHIHVPEGAVPKDGPSAGAAIFTAMLSALSGKQVNPDVAMTGEISLTGRILPIGGLREKTMAAFSANIPLVLIPQDNLPDLEDVDTAIKDALTIVGIKHLSEVPSFALRTSVRTEENPKRKQLRDFQTAGAVQ